MMWEVVYAKLRPTALFARWSCRPAFSPRLCRSGRDKNQLTKMPSD
jgi:hypothetical protein